MIFQIGLSHQKKANNILVNFNYLVSDRMFFTTSFSIPKTFNDRLYRFYNSYFIGYQLKKNFFYSKYSTLLFGAHRSSIENFVNEKWYNIGVNNFYKIQKLKFYSNLFYLFNSKYIEKSISVNSIFSINKNLFFNFGIGYSTIKKTKISFELGLLI